MRKVLKLDRDDFFKYSVCDNCTKMIPLHSYEPSDADVICKFVRFPQGRKFKQPCGGHFFKKTKLKRGTVKYTPHQVYCYRSVIDSLETLLKRPNIEDYCELWRTRNVPVNHYADLYDGQMWKKFQNVKGHDFLAKPNNYAFMINVDWFQPFKRRADISVGAIYLVLANLPRSLRFKRENVLLAGIIPPMTNEPRHLNEFLQPLVTELQKLWQTGVKMNTYKHQNGVIVKACLLCAPSDLPATRKLCDF